MHQLSKTTLPLSILIASLFVHTNTANAACQTSLIVPGVCTDQGFATYLSGMISGLMPLILFIAVVLVAWSGVQYMLGGATKDSSSKAKQRITGVLGGVIFFLLISFILSRIAPDIISTNPTPQKKTEPTPANTLKENPSTQKK
jgi:hypothetical protein